MSELPEGWKIRSLKEICRGQLQTGPFGSQLHSHEYVENGISVVMPKDLTKHSVNLKTAAKILPSKADLLKKHKLETGDLIFSRRGDVSRFALINDESADSICGTGCLRARPSKEHSPIFLSYFLQLDHVKKWLEQNAVGQTMLNMNTEILGKLPLITATTFEENKIAQILSTWDRAIATTEKRIANSKQQKKALMQQLLTGKKRLAGFSGDWEVVKLGDVSHITTGSSNREDSSLDGEYTFFDRSEDIRTSSRYLFDASAVIVPGEGQDFVPKYFEGKFDLHQRTYAVMDFEQADSKFMYYYIGYYRHYFLSQAVGSTVKSLRLPMFQKMPINLPPLPEQQKIAQVLTTADKEISALETQLAHLQQEKKALMQQLLTGKRRVVVEEG